MGTVAPKAKERIAILHARLYFVVFIFAMAVAVYQTSSSLSNRIVSHLGRITATELRESGHRHQPLVVVATVATPVLLYSILALLPVRPRSLMPLPHPEYWLSPERRRDTVEWNEKFSLLCSAMVAVFIYCANLSAVHSVRLPDGSFEFPWLGTIGVAWVIFIVGSAVLFRRRFGRMK